MGIVRGYSFDVNEFVTNTSLHQLVDSASVSDLDPDNFTGEIHGLSTATPASIRDGDILFLNEDQPNLTRPAAISQWSHPIYLVHYNGQWVSLFGGDHLESGRFFNGVGSAIARGEVVSFNGQTGSGAVTLTSNINSNAAAKGNTIGSNHGPSAADTEAMRVRIIGHGLFLGSSKTADATWMDVVWHGSATSVWQRSTATDTNGYNAMRLNNTADADSDTGRLQPCYHFGALNFKV